MQRLALLFLLLLCSPHALFAQGQGQGQAQPLSVFQSGGLFTNDFLGDGQDRWRTVSAVQGFDFAQANRRYTAYMRAEMIAPDDLTGASPRPDRRYAGVLEAALNRHWQSGALHSYIGGGVTLIGPATGIGTLQRSFHDLIGSTEPGVLATQLPNAAYPLLQAGASHHWRLPGQSLGLHIDAVAGAESLVRAGVDWTFGAQAARPPLLRDPTTGTPLSTGQRDAASQGLSFLAGADVSYIADSRLFPNGGVAPKQTRNRARLGLAWQGQGFSAFYGVTWLGPEFEDQEEGQVLGSIGLNLRF